MSRIQRYELTAHNSLKESDNGMWAIWQHAADRIEALEREIANLRAERDEARKRTIEDAAVVAENCQLNMPLMIGAAEGAARASLQIAAAIRNMGGGENG